MAVTPDNSTLLVADSYRHRLVAFAIASDGELSDRRVWVDLGEGIPDGIYLDAEGAVWYANVPNRWCARVAEGGTVVQTELDRGGFACARGAWTERPCSSWPPSGRGMTEPEPVTPGTGQVLTTPVDVPGPGWP
jgi:hypothetical protein